MNATAQLATNVRDLALPFFFAVYWSAMISSMDTLQVFQIWTLGKEGHGWRVALRLIYGVLLLNVVPILIFAFIYSSPWFVIVPDEPPGAILCAGIASLSVFSVVFLLPGFLQLGLWKALYPVGSWPELIYKRFDLASGEGTVTLLITSAAYIVFPIATSWFIARTYA